MILYHGTLRENLPFIVESGIRRGEGWGGAGTSGVFLSGTPEGALYWAKMAYQREREGDLEVWRFDRKHKNDMDSLLVVLPVLIPPSAEDLLRADEEQFEDVGADFPATDWRQSLEVIGDVRYDGEIPPHWVVGVIKPSEIKPTRL